MGQSLSKTQCERLATNWVKTVSECSPRFPSARLETGRQERPDDRKTLVCKENEEEEDLRLVMNANKFHRYV